MLPNVGRCKVLAFLVALAVLVLLPPPAYSQSATATVLGRVLDPQGAAVAGAKISVVNENTKVVYDTVTDNEGNYRVIALPIGSYRVIAEHAGFTSAKTEPYVLQINQNQKIDIKLQVGATSEVVDVKADAAGVETVSSTVGASVTERPIVNLPLNGRRVLDLALLQPGVSESNSDDTGAGTFNIAGGRADSVTFLLDGGNDNNLLSNGVVFTPNPDAVAEFRILENNYGAEYGRNAGGIVTLVTKSGTNALHGSAYDFLRNDALNANSYFNKRTDPITPRDRLKRNQFGATAGGPLKKDKIFWFVSYQGQRQSQSVSQPLAVFSQAGINGDFSSYPDPVAKQGIVDFLQSHPYFQPDPNKQLQAIIDPTKIDPVSQKFIAAKLIPVATTGWNQTYQASATDNRNELMTKFDLNVTNDDRIAVTLGMNKGNRLVPFRNAATAPGYPNTYQSNQYFLNLGYTKTITPTLLNEARMTAQRNRNINAIPAATLPKPKDLGVNINSDDPYGPPRIGFYASNTITGFSPQGPTTLADNTFSYTDTLSWVKGRHTVKTGFAFTPYENNTTYEFYTNGEFDFDGVTPGFTNTGLDLADFLLGLPDYFFQSSRAPSNIRTKAYSGFFQDEWKVSKNLVLTLGLRYEYSTPKFDTQGRSFTVAPGVQSTRFVNAPRGLIFPGDPGAPKGANFPDRNDFAPRFGFAWDPQGSGKMSIRGGFGVYYDVLKGEDNLQFNGQPPFFGYGNLFPPDVGSTNPTSNYQFMSDVYGQSGYPQAFPSKPPASNLDWYASGFLPYYGGSGLYFVDPHLRTPYTMQFNLSVQREIARDMTAQVAYVGSLSRKLTSLQDANPFDPATGNRILNQGTGTQPDNFTYMNEFRNVVNASYNGLQASLTKKTSDTHWFGTTYFTLGYTWQKSMDNASGFRERTSQVATFNPGESRAVSDFDVTNRITFSGGWDLPFDKLGGPKALVKGWSVYPIFTWRTGYPLTIYRGLTQSCCSAGSSGAGDRNLTRVNAPGGVVPIFNPNKPDPTDPTVGNQYFPDKNYFTTPTSGYGNVMRNSFRGPGRTNLDFAFAKTTPLFTEKANLEFRVEMFNMFNHAEFGTPSTTYGSTLGIINTTYDPRIIQLGARIKF